MGPGRLLASGLVFAKQFVGAVLAQRVLGPTTVVVVGLTDSWVVVFVVVV